MIQYFLKIYLVQIYVQKKSNLSYSVHAGSRLIFTNLKSTKSFPNETTSRSGDSRGDEYLNYIIIKNDEVKLAEAAALNANFPPVFSDAGVFITSDDPDKEIKNIG